MSAADGRTLSGVLADALHDLLEGWRSQGEQGQGRTRRGRLALVSVGAFVFSYPMFLVHFSELIERRLGLSEGVGLSLTAVVPCALLALAVACLIAWDSKVENWVRLFLSGFLLPYLVAVLLAPLMQSGGGAP